MATGVVIRLRNLPLSAGTLDIRQFFGGLRIPDGGVHIIGGDDGTAFILFSTDEDARQAMIRDGQPILGVSIKLTLSSHSEMKGVIEASQRACEELRGLRPPEPPIANMTNRSSAAGRTEYISMRPAYGKSSSPEMMPPMASSDLYIEMNGMPLDVTENEILYFFAPIPILSFRYVLDESGRRTGSVLVMFKSVVDKYEALKKDHQVYGNCYIKLLSASERQWQMASVQLFDPALSAERKRPLSPNEGTPKRSRAFSPLRSENCVEVRGLPMTANFKSVGEFFKRLRFADGGLYVEVDGKTCKGRAFVEFLTYADFKEALLKDGDMLNGKQIRVISVSKQNMIEQIRIHKKYIKSKQEEEFLREKEKKQLERKLKEEKRREHQMRKQKEMDEWLRRQHQKEQEDRKLQLERQNFFKSQEDKRNMEEERRILQMQLDKNIESTLKVSQAKIPEASVKEEPVSGAAEMEIEEEPVVSTSVSIIKETVSVTPTHSTPVDIIASPAISYVLPPAVPPFPMPPPGLPPASFPPLAPDFIPPVGLPAPPLPNPSIPPPPVPPMMAPPKLPDREESAPAPPAPSDVKSEPSKVAETNGTLTDSSSNQEPAEQVTLFIRVANSPFSVTEEQVRDFFSEVNIVRKGIQFIDRNDGRRSGHIFIKCASPTDATKAATKNNQNLLDRSVLVQKSSLDKFQEIYYRLTKGKFIPTFPVTASNLHSDLSNDNSMTERILAGGLTCVCVGNLPWDTKEEDLLISLQGYEFVKNTIVILKELDGRCKGEAYVELITPPVCAKVADLHGSLKVRGVTVRILPMSRFDMMMDIESHDKRINAELTMRIPERSLSHAGGSHPTQSLRSYPLDRADLQPFLPRDSRMLPPKGFPPMVRDLPPMIRDDIGRHPSGYPPMMVRDVFPPLPDGRVPPYGHPEYTLRPRSPIPEELLRLRGPPGFDGPPFLPPSMMPPRMPGGHFPPPREVVPLKMSNLNFKITQEDILEFFYGFDPIPSSVRLMYNKSGKLTGEGMISFPNIDAARAAIDKLNGVQLLSRPTKLFLQQP